MTLNQAKALIDQAISSGEFSHVGITGGEALLYEAEVFEIVEYAHSLGLNTSIATNGYWGVSMAEATVKLKRLKALGITFLTLSSDEFHSEYIPDIHIEYILKANETVGLKLKVHTVKIKHSLPHFLMEKYEDDRWHDIKCLPVGNAKKNIASDVFVMGDYSGKCNMADTVTITPNGEAYPCCSPGAHVKGLNLGNVFKTSLKSILKVRRELDYFNVVIRKGPNWLKILGESKGIQMTFPKNEYISMCHLCHEIGRDEAFLDKMNLLITENTPEFQFYKFLKL